MTDSNLGEELKREFSRFLRPKCFFELGAYNKRRFSKQIAAFQNIDWHQVRPEDLDGFYEISPSLSAAAYLYILPNMFEFCRRWRGGRGPWDQLDFIDVYLRLPLIEGGDRIYGGLSARQRELLWLFLTTTSALIGSGVYDDFDDADVASLRKKLQVDSSGNYL